MGWFDRIVAVHTAVTDQVSHRRRLKSQRYFVWQEEGQNVLGADSCLGERAIQGSTDLFTKQENDPWKAAFETSLDAAVGVAWYLNSIQYEEDTGFVHYEWVWEVICGETDDFV